MPRWIPITKDTLYGAAIGALIDACDTAALSGGQPGRAADQISGVVNEVRTAIASCKDNSVDADPTTVPANWRDLVVDLIIARLKRALGQELTQDDRDNLQWRQSQLKQIASCDLTVDSPDNPITPPVEGGTGTQLVRPGLPPGGGRHPFGML